MVSADLHWVVLLTNNIINPYYEWPLGDYAFQQFVYDKYSNPEADTSLRSDAIIRNTETRGSW